MLSRAAALISRNPKDSTAETGFFVRGKRWSQTTERKTVWRVDGDALQSDLPILPWASEVVMLGHGLALCIRAQLMSRFERGTSCGSTRMPRERVVLDRVLVPSFPCVNRLTAPHMHGLTWGRGLDLRLCHDNLGYKP